MSCVYRVFALILLMLLSACATCAILFPIFRKPKTTVAEVTTKDTIYYWYAEVSAVSPTSTQIVRTYTRDYTCAAEKTYFVVSSALAVAGAGLGGLACLFMACWTTAGHRAGLGVVSILFTFFAFACCTVVVSLTAYLYVNAQCKSETVAEKQTFQQQDYKLVEGFILMAVAAGGFLVMLLVQLIAMCCCFCCGGSSHYDNISPDLSRHSSKSSGDSRESYTRDTSRRGSSRSGSFRR